MKIFITGSKGQLGKEVQKHLVDYDLILTDIDELDITNENDTLKAILHTKPDLLINCAAYTDVDKCEAEEEEVSYKINTIGPRNLALATDILKIPIVHISTDYVFDGEGIIENSKIRPYLETDNPNPQTQYGRTKLQGEKYVQQINPKHFIIRSAWLYGEGNNFVRTMIRLSEKYQKIKVVRDQIGTPTSTTQLANMIIDLMNSDNYGLYHGTCEGQCSWFEFAKEIFEIKGIKTIITPCTTEEFPRPAPRPKYSVLENYHLKEVSKFRFPHWKEELDRYLR